MVDHPTATALAEAPHDAPDGGDARTIRRDIACVGASAGGVEALIALVRHLPGDIPVAFLVVLHTSPGGTSRLPDVLSRSGPLRASFARHGAMPRPGRIYVAPPDTHLMLSGEQMVVLDGPRENGFRPAVDPLFRSAARWAGPRAIGIVLSGTLDDGAAGISAIQAFGGATIVQAPGDALCDGMPEAALDVIEPDHVVPAAEIGPLVARIASETVRVPTGRPEPDSSLIADPMLLAADGVDLSCPDCGGSLQEVLAGAVPRLRCRVGHVYSLESLLARDGTALEGALWAALRALEETAVVSSRLARRARDAGRTLVAQRFEDRQADAATRADVIREAFHTLGRPVNQMTEIALGGELGDGSGVPGAGPRGRRAAGSGPRRRSPRRPADLEGHSEMRPIERSRGSG